MTIPAAPLERQSRPASQWVLPVAGVVALAIAALFYCYDTAEYMRIMRALMIVPYQTPYIDAQQVPAVIECWKHGIDVYVTAPCDPMQRRWAYSPFWLWATFIPARRNWMGLALDTAFFISLAVLPRPRERVGTTVLILATFSSMPVFALERGNMDIVMFVLIAMGGWLWCRNFSFRLAGYALFACAGFLKFYPLVLFSLFIRERTGVFIALSGLALALIFDFFSAYHGLLREAAQNLPVFSYFTDAFGAAQLPGGFLTALRQGAALRGVQTWLLLSAPIYAVFFPITWLTLCAAAACAALRLAATPLVSAAIAKLAPDELGFLIIGAALICGCFFAGMNDSYRGVYFLFILPGMLALAAMPGGRVFGFCAAGIVFLMWGLTLQSAVAKLSGGVAYPMSGSVAIYVYWLIHELVWWCAVSVLLGVLFCFVAQSSAWHALKHAVRHREPVKT